MGMNQETACPLCGSALVEGPATTFDAYVPMGRVVRGRELPTKERQTTVAACSGCEFLIDLRRPDGVPKSSSQLLVEVGKWVRDVRTTRRKGAAQ